MMGWFVAGTALLPDLYHPFCLSQVGAPSFPMDLSLPLGAAAMIARRGDSISSLKGRAWRRHEPGDQDNGKNPSHAEAMA